MDHPKNIKKLNKEKKTNLEKPNGTKSTINKLIQIYQHHLVIIWLFIIVIPIIIITIGCFLLPDLFYDQFIWRFFWGTIEADAQDRSYGEITEEYNPVNTIVYALIVILTLYWIYKLFKKLKIEIDFKFFIAIIPFILIGGISRSLEDAELFSGPIVYLFIAPIIYVFIGLIVIGLSILGAGLKKFTSNSNLNQGILIIGWLLVCLDIIYLIAYFVFSDQFSYMLNPIIPVIISLILFVGFKKYIQIIKKIEIPIVLLMVGLWSLAINLIVLSQWQSVRTWSDAYSTVNPGKTIELQPIAFIIVFGIALLCVSVVYILARLFLTKYTSLKPFLLGTNLLLFFGHFLDASATFIAVDYYGYVEKHVLPSFLIDTFHTAAIMLILKAIIVIAVIYFIDILYKEDFQNNPTLTGLVRIAVLVLGLAPGIRDILRLAIGV